MVILNVARSDPSMPWARATGRTAQQREPEWAARAKEKKIRWRQHLEQHNEEYRLREQQGLSPPPAPVNSSLEEEESDGERTTSDRWEPMPLSSRAEGAAVELVPEAGVESPVAGPSEKVLAGTMKVPVGAAEVPPIPQGRGSGDSPILGE
jgi:hypothetical protein